MAKAKAKGKPQAKKANAKGKAKAKAQALSIIPHKTNPTQHDPFFKQCVCFVFVFQAKGTGGLSDTMANEGETSAAEFVDVDETVPDGHVDVEGQTSASTEKAIEGQTSASTEKATEGQKSAATEKSNDEATEGQTEVEFKVCLARGMEPIDVDETVPEGHVIDVDETVPDGHVDVDDEDTLPMGSETPETASNEMTNLCYYITGCRGACYML